MISCWESGFPGAKWFLSPWRLIVILWRAHNLGLSGCKGDYTRRNWGSVWMLVGLYQDQTMLYNLDLHRPDSHIFCQFVNVLLGLITPRFSIEQISVFYHLSMLAWNYSLLSLSGLCSLYSRNNFFVTF